jgi:hypothetical protein
MRKELFVVRLGFFFVFVFEMCIEPKDSLIKVGAVPLKYNCSSSKTIF